MIDLLLQTLLDSDRRPVRTGVRIPSYRRSSPVCNGIVPAENSLARSRLSDKQGEGARLAPADGLFAQELSLCTGLDLSNHEGIGLA